MANGWTLGALLYPGGGFGLPGSGRGYTQPGGPFTPAYPEQIVDPSSTIAPFATTPVTEQTGVMSFACSHFADEPYVVRDYDYNTGMSVALICCPICLCVSGMIEPYELWLSPTQNPIVFP